MPIYNTTFEDYSPLINYSPDWRAGSSNGDSAASLYSDASFTLTQKDGGTASFTFNGTAVTIFGSQRANHGFYQVTIDGNTFPPISGKAADPGHFQVPLFESPVLSQGQHSVTFTNQGSTFVDIDFVTVQNTVGQSEEPLIVNTVQDSDPAFVWQPANVWGTNVPFVGTYSGSSGHGTATPGDAVYLYGPVGPTSAPFSVSLDGGAPENYSAVKQSYKSQVLLYSATNLGRGQHQIKVTYEPSQPGQILAIDYANVYTTSSLGGTSNLNSDSSGSSSLRSGISGGGIAAIIIAVLFVLFVVAALLFLLQRRRKRKSQAMPTPIPQPPMSMSRANADIVAPSYVYNPPPQPQRRPAPSTRYPSTIVNYYANEPNRDYVVETRSQAGSEPDSPTSHGHNGLAGPSNSNMPNKGQPSALGVASRPQDFGSSAPPAYGMVSRVSPDKSNRGPLQTNIKAYGDLCVECGERKGSEASCGGNGINCVRIVPYSAVQFTAYESLKKWFASFGNKELDTPRRLAAGALAGICSVCSTYPLDLVRARLSIATASIPISISSKPASSSTAKIGLSAAYHTSSYAASELTIIGMTRKIVREEGGVRGLYRGLVTTAFGVAPYVGINFAAYEFLRGVITPPGKTSVPRKLACGALAGSISQTLTYPFDVLRRKMQVTGMKSSGLGIQYTGALDALQGIVRSEGFIGLYRGLWPNLLKVAPSIATSFFTSRNGCWDNNVERGMLTTNPGSLFCAASLMRNGGLLVAASNMAGRPIQGGPLPSTPTSSISSWSSSESNSTRPDTPDQHASTTLPAALMGQNESKQALPTSPSSQKSFYVAASTGSKLKRAFARRKKSEDPAVVLTEPQQPKRQLPFVKKPTAPPLPPKPTILQVAKPIPLPPIPLPPIPPEPTITPANRGSIIPVTPGVSPAVNWLISQERAKNAIPEVEPESDSKEAWRRSDATITRAPTVTRSSRPVSTAESTHTVTPVNKRLSAVINDEDYLAEEDDEEYKDSRSSPSASIRNKPRSMSLNIGPTEPFQPTMASPKLSSESVPPLTPSMVRETPTLTRAAANGIISPSSSGLQSTGNNIRGRLAAWTATTNSTPTINSHTEIQAQSRKPAVSLTASLAPAAGLAKRAVEKMGRWGFGSNNNNSGYSSSSSTPPSSFGHEHGLVRTNSNQSGGGKAHRRTPNSVSSAWSVNSSNMSSSVSDLNAFAPPPEAYLGKCIRGPLKKSNTGAGVGGVVFGASLQVAVAETAVSGYTCVEVEDISLPLSARLEQRLLPALVVRCAQHILIWGVQEEGLFRVPGRPSHTSKLRAEFDTGADYDIRECSLGDLDPHAVGSVFKAYLRELPEPILTQALTPYFDAALAQEQNTEQEQAPRPRAAPTGPTLPSGPRAGHMMRKPPSLSTLAPPNLNTLRAPSPTLVQAVRNLVKQLPRENRDLLRTVIDLIRATAEHNKETKMPLSNLLLIFCPSLNMSPPMLRVLCEAEAVWGEEPVVDIKRESLGVLDIKPEGKEEPESPVSPTRLRSPGARSKRANPVAVYVDDDNAEDSPLTQMQAASDVSSVSTSEDISIIPRFDASSPMLSSSSESLATPSSSPSIAHIPLEKEAEEQVQFPTSNNSSDVPIPSPPTLSLPSLSSSPKSDSNSAGSTPPSPFRRLKKTSLHLLFSKRSASPLTPSPTGGFPNISGPYLQAPRAASESSLSTPISAVTAPSGSPLGMPPVLDTPIDSSSLRAGLGITVDSPEPDESEESEEEDIPLPVVGQTPIADMYRTPASSSLAVNHLRPHPTRKQSKASVASSNGSNPLGIVEDEEDWTQSVLVAADVDWRMQGP
ncbi:Rho-GAP domain-containing protein [Mycena indigotica]|uniref:Rho-GAP domain-containing protein n=1 Tax=Mycena indigotica TaxID=2126181 RepID=A0A8H6TFE6_9AGAR|nr:Rho-GAP domain-containing protein [Mycena indigotica]KAF7315702.1 Rho-GAP domain-containing protein [Mycena indigotica]